MFSGLFTDEEFDRVEDKGSVDTTMVDVQTLLEAFLNMFLRSACFTDDTSFFFLVKSESSCLGTTLLNTGLSEVQIIRHQIKGSLLYMLPTKYT